MIKIIDHGIASSLKEFLVYRALTDLQAFETVTGQLFQTSTKWSNLTALGAGQAGFVYDSSVAAAPSPPFFGAITDYRNGRFLVPTGVYSGLSSVFSVPEFNFYTTSSSEGKLIFETKFNQPPNYQNPKAALPEDSFILPAIFVKSYQTESETHCLGGTDELTWNFKIVCFAESDSQLLGMQKLVRDSRQEVFPILSGSVLNGVGDLKTNGWNYPLESENMTDYGYITDSTFRIQENDLFTDKNPSIFLGIGNIEVSYYKHPDFTIPYVPPTPVSGFLYLQPDGITRYLRTDGSSLYYRSEFVPVDYDFYYRPDGVSLLYRPDGTSLLHRPEPSVYTRFDGSSRFFRPDGSSVYLSN